MPSIEKKGSTTPKKSTEATLEAVTNSSINYEKKVTVNLGDYNSVSIKVGVTLPLNPTKEMLENVDETIEVAIELVENKVESLIEDLDN